MPTNVPLPTAEVSEPVIDTRAISLFSPYPVSEAKVPVKETLVPAIIAVVCAVPDQLGWPYDVPS